MNHTSYISGQGVGGNITLQVLKISALKLGSANTVNPYIIIQPEEGYFKQKGAVGFMGNNMMEKYGSVVLDFPAKKAYIAAAKKPAMVKKKTPVRKAVATR